MPRKPRPPPPPQPPPAPARGDEIRPLTPLPPLKPVAQRIGESPGNLRAREEAFRKRRRGGPA